MTDLEQLEYINQLLLLYGSLLTDLQKNMMDDYYVYNLSLSEISENRHVSRAAINDCLKKARRNLEEFEQNLHLLANKHKLQSLLEKWKKDERISRQEIVLEIERMMEDGI